MQVGRQGASPELLSFTVVEATMHNTVWLLAVLLAELEIRQVSCKKWSHSKDPKNEGWGGHCLTGRHQSPINLVYKNVWRAKVEPLRFINYVNVNTTVCNNGHSVVLKVNQDCEPSIVAGGLRDLFILDEVTFHWGSEHTIKDKRYPLEMHLIHYNSNYENKNIALCHSDGLAIISILFCASGRENEFLNPIITALENEFIYRSFGNMSTISEPINLERLLPYEHQKFFRYHGSITTPPCTEIVIWTIMEQTSYISKSQLMRFCKIRTRTGGNTNFRWQKPLNNRKLYLLTGDKPKTASSNIMTIFICLFIISSCKL